MMRRYCCILPTALSAETRVRADQLPWSAGILPAPGRGQQSRTPGAGGTPVLHKRQARASLCRLGSRRRWVTYCLLALAFCPVPSACAQAIITTVAGSTFVFQGDGKPAAQAPIGQIQGVAADAAGNVYASGVNDNLVFKISSNGILTVVAGNGINAFSGDGGPATNAAFSFPTGLAVDGAGNLYIAEVGNHRVRKVNADGNIITVAGNGAPGFSGDGGPATAAALNFPTGVAVDAAGNVFIADRNNQRIRKVDAAGIIATVAGSGTTGYSGDGGPATAASLALSRVGLVSGVAVDALGNLYIADSENGRVRRVDPAGKILTVAGTGAAGYSGDGGPAVGAGLNSPQGVAVDASGNLYIADAFNNVVRMVNSAGIIRTVAGSGARGFSGDGGAAVQAALANESALAVDPAGNLYIADAANSRVRKVSSAGIITTLAGNGLNKFGGDGGAAIRASLNSPQGVAVDAAGNIFIADSLNNRIRKTLADGTVITTAAGSGAALSLADGGAATNAALGSPASVAVDSAGNIFIADDANHRVRKVAPNGVITTVAGNGVAGSSGDNIPAVSAALNHPIGVALDAAGNLYITDRFNNRVRKVSAAGIITTVAGNSVAGFSGDNGPATGAQLRAPFGVAVDAGGNLYIGDDGNNRVRKVSAAGIITTVAGNGLAGSSGDGGPATVAALNSPRGVAVDGAGNLYVADSGNHRVRKVSAGVISTVAGNGTGAFWGDGGPPTAASLNCPSGVAVDIAGRLYVADLGNDRIRKIEVPPVAPSLALAPSTLTFTAAAGATSVPPLQISVSGPLAGLPWTVQAASETGNWLAATPGAGEVPGTINVSVNVSGLTPGTYRGAVAVQAPLAAPPTQNVTAQLTVTPALPAKLAVEPASLSFESTAGTTNPSAQSLRVDNAGSGTLSWRVRAGTAGSGSWLSVSQASGYASSGSPASVRVTANIFGLVPGVYTTALQVEGLTTGETVTVPVTLLVAQVTQTILVSQSALLFTGVQGGDSAPPQSLGILNTGQGVMSWTVRSETLSGGSWLRVSPSSGRSDANSLQIPQVDVSVSVAGLRAGQYSGLVRVEAPGADNSPQYVSAELNVLPVGSNPGVLVRPTGLIFAARAGTSSPGSQTVRLATATPGSVAAVGGLLTFDGGNWLQALPTNLVLSTADPRNIVIQPALASLAPGIYRAALTLLFDDGSPCQPVNVLFLVVGSGVRTAARRAQADSDGACVPARLHAVHRTLGNSFSAPVSWPSPVEVQVLDDCGTAVGNATVVASFTNGDVPLALTSLRNGTYIGTWRPSSAATQVVVTVRASLPPLTPVELQARGAVGANARAPALNSGGVVNGASFAPTAPLAPGSIVSVFGANFASTNAGASSLPLPKTLAGASLQVGGLDVPLFYSSGGQINAQLPFELTLNTRPQLIVKGADFVTVPETITVAAARPGIFTTSQDGKGQGVIMDTANRLVDASNPAQPGDVVVVYCTGLGATNPAVRSGEAAPASPLAKVTTPVSVTIGGQPAVVQFAGLTPGYAGLYQVNVQIPSGVTPGSSVPLVISQDGVPSNTVTLGIR